jgi:uncharacterized protein YqeY
MSAQPLKARLQDIIKSAMKGGDKDTLLFARSLHAAIRKREIDDRVDLDDAGVIKIVQTLVKQRIDSIEQFRAGAREDLASKEEAEKKFLETFLPAQMGESEIRSLVSAAILESGAKDLKDLGKVMKILVPKTQGVADGKLVNQLVKEGLEKGV